MPSVGWIRIRTPETRRSKEITNQHISIPAQPVPVRRHERTHRRRYSVGQIAQGINLHQIVRGNGLIQEILVRQDEECSSVPNQQNRTYGREH